MALWKMASAPPGSSAPIKTLPSYPPPVGLGEVRLSSMALAVGGLSLCQFPLSMQGDAEIVVGQGIIGLSSMALRQAASPSVSFP